MQLLSEKSIINSALPFYNAVKEKVTKYKLFLLKDNRVIFIYLPPEKVFSTNYKILKSGVDPIYIYIYNEQCKNGLHI